MLYSLPIYTLSFRNPLHRAAIAKYPELLDYDTIVLYNVFFSQDSLQQRLAKINKKLEDGGGIDSFYKQYDARTIYYTIGKAYLPSIYYTLANVALLAVYLLDELFYTKYIVDSQSAGINSLVCLDFVREKYGVAYSYSSLQLAQHQAGPKFTTTNNNCYICYIIEVYIIDTFGIEIILTKREQIQNRTSLITRNQDSMPSYSDDLLLSIFDSSYIQDTSD